MKPLLHVISFWVCTAMALANLFLFFISKAFNDEASMKLNLLTMLVCVFGAGLHWVADRRLKKEKK